MLPKEVQDVQVKDTFEFDRSGMPIKVTVYTYYVGKHGPFTRKFGAGEREPAHVAKVINEHVAELRALGII